MSQSEWRDDAEAQALIDAIRGKPRMALRYADDELDDVVVELPLMFRAEMMDDKTLWLCCYFGADKGEHVTFWVRSKRGKLDFGVTETPGEWEDRDAKF